MFKFFKPTLFRFRKDFERIPKSHIYKAIKDEEAFD